ncbi:interleukin-13 receptor subunit alpha-2 isoform X2 [Puntigrus tetrazona]|uniref:interleukin-13 receptor subunit alpha-2 isoform X2 n=1 Tax=Puntigrus tetrazona TaxID=1606681 RepID=UPI001C89E60F|nr:interleukin-13 receptor subunit alpha-2 isoform X2 [Puntigrus tetrazona]
MLLLNKVHACLSAFALLLLTQEPVSTSEFTDCGDTDNFPTVDPPANIEITDPGFLGYISIHWTRPASLQNLTGCSVRYQLRYYDTYEERWRSVRTAKLTYTAQFDLEKPIKVRMLTVLKCACTNGTEVQGEETEWVYAPEPTGVAGSRIRDFHCVYYGKEYMECTWDSGPVIPPNSQHYLYYWHREMDETKECPEYIILSEGRRGCRFPQKSLLEFSKFNLCVNGSSPAGNLKTAYFSIEVQNHVKPEVVSSVHVSEIDGELKLDWSPPSGQVPEHCLEYEVESSTTMKNGKEKKENTVIQNLEDTSYGVPKETESQKTCFRIRSKVNMYCADEGFWSDWSQAECTEDNEKTQYLSLVGLVVIGIAGVILLCLLIWILKQTCIKKMNKKDALYTLYKEKVNETMPNILSPIFK